MVQPLGPGELPVLSFLADLMRSDKLRVRVGGWSGSGGKFGDEAAGGGLRSWRLVMSSCEGGIVDLGEQA